ncbi:MAG: TPM domain-containing protein [Bacteroidales bacterium]|nr:TPM domain-containing protein [Bacteroidales bacterium]
MSKIKFSEAEKEQIKNAVKELESKTSSEIVPYFVERSDNYYEAPFVGAVLMSFLIVVTLNFMSWFWILPTKFDIFSYSIVSVLVVAVVFFVLMISPFLRVLIIPEKREKKMVYSRAVDAFLSEEVFKTKKRTGILIFVSKLERNVVILADKGINERVSAEQWQHIVDKLTLGIKKNKVVESFEIAIKDCENVLLKAGFINEENDLNEISDEIRE